MEAALDVEAKRGESGGDGDRSNKRSGLEKAAGEVVSGGDPKRLREGNNDHAAMEVEEEEEEMGPYEIFEIHRKEWIESYGKNDDAAFYKPSTYLIFCVCRFLVVSPLNLRLVFV